MVDLNRAGVGSPLEVDVASGVRVGQITREHLAVARPGLVRLVDQVAAQNVIAGVAAVAIHVSPRLAELVTRVPGLRSAPLDGQLGKRGSSSALLGSHRRIGSRDSLGGLGAARRGCGRWSFRRLILRLHLHALGCGVARIGGLVVSPATRGDGGNDEDDKHNDGCASTTFILLLVRLTGGWTGVLVGHFCFLAMPLLCG